MIPSSIDPQNARALIQNSDGIWEEADAEEDGSYLVFQVSSQDQAVSIYSSQAKSLIRILIISTLTVAAVILISVMAAFRKKKKKAVKKA